MTINTEALAERLGPSKKQIKRQQKFDTVYQWVAGIIDDGHFEQRSVPAGLVVGDNFVACISRERKRYDVVEVSNMLIVIRATDGYTVTLLKYNPNAVNSAGRRPKQKQAEQAAYMRRPVVNAIPNETMQEIADYLLGTCKDEYEAAQAFDLDDDASEEILSRILDYEIERCECCSWWCEIYELNEDNLCEDCRDDC